MWLLIVQFLSEHWVDIVGVLGTLLASTGWYKASKSAGGYKAGIVDLLSRVAVDKTEQEYVAPTKASNVAKGLVAKLTPVQQRAASKSAVEQILQVAESIEPRLAQLPLSEWYDAVEKAVGVMKAKLPDATQDRFRGLGTVLVILAAGLLCGGCSTLWVDVPADWELSVAEDCGMVADAALAQVFSEAAADTAELAMLRSVGNAGALQFKGLGKVDKDGKVLDMNQRLKVTVAGMNEYARSVYADMLNDMTLYDLIRQTLNVRAGDTDCVLGLLEAALRAG